MNDDFRNLYEGLLQRRFPKLGYTHDELIMYDADLAGFLSRAKGGEIIPKGIVPRQPKQIVRALLAIAEKPMKSPDEVEFVAYCVMLERIRRALTDEP